MFFDDFSNPVIHRRMLRDRIRCGAYKSAIERVVKPGSIVADVGAGTGILAIMAANAGAAKVYAIEPTRTIELAKEIVHRNGVADRIELIHGYSHAVELPEKVDVILSEWMGSYGIDENFLHGVLVARDKWLKPGGKMVPEQATTFLAPIEDRTFINTLEFWRSRPYGIDFSIMGDRLLDELMFCDYDLQADDILADPHLAWSHSTYTTTQEQSKGPFTTRHRFIARRKGRVAAIATWFEAVVSEGITITNAPGKPKTHWRNAIAPLSQPQEVSEGTAIDVEFTATPTEPGVCYAAWKVSIGDFSEQHDSFVLIQGSEASNDDRKAFQYVYAE